MAKTKAAAEAAEGEGMDGGAADAAEGQGATDGAADALPDAAAPALLPPAVVVKAFDGVPDGLVYPRSFEPGETVLGALADVAVAEGWATRGEA